MSILLISVTKTNSADRKHSLAEHKIVEVGFCRAYRLSAVQYCATVKGARKAATIGGPFDTAIQRCRDTSLWGAKSGSTYRAYRALLCHASGDLIPLSFDFG
jgi:hypothetical protein